MTFQIRRLRSVAVLLVVLSLAAAASAQSTFGSITGIVTDPTGAVVPGAAIVVVNPYAGRAQHGQRRGWRLPGD